MKKPLIYLLVVLLGGLFFYGCEKRYQEFDKLKTNTNWEPQLAVPIMSAEISMEDLLARNSVDLIQTDDNGKITLIYETTRQEFNPLQLIPNLDQQFSQVIPSGFPGTLTATQPGQFDYVKEREIDMSTPNAEQVKEVKFRSGKLIIDLSANFPNVTPDLQISYSLPKLILANGQTFSDTLSIPTGQTSNIEIDLAGAVLDLTSASGLVDNKFTLSYSAVLAFNTGDKIESTDNFTFDFELTNLKIQHIIADIGNQVHNIINDSINLTIFGAVSDIGDVGLTNPQLFIEFNNAIGVPFSLDFEKLYTRNDATGDKFDLFFQSFVNPFPINSPLAIGDSARTEIRLDKTNTDLIEILKPTPKWLVYKVNAEINPGPGPNYNFISDESFFVARGKAVIPLEGYANNIWREDTIDFSLGSTVDELEEATLNLRITNGLPLDAFLQIYLWDENLGIIDSILTNENTQIFKAGEPGASGKIDQSTVEERQVLITVDQAKAESMIQAEQMLVRTNMSSFDAPTKSVAFYSDYRLGIAMGIKLKGSIEVPLP